LTPLDKFCAQMEDAGLTEATGPRRSPCVRRSLKIWPRLSRKSRCHETHGDSDR